MTRWKSIAVGTMFGIGLCALLAASTTSGPGPLPLQYRYPTNAIPSSGTLQFGQSYQTNTAGANVAYGAMTIGAQFYETCVIYYTNSSSTDSALTFNGIHGLYGSIPAVYYATNQHMTRVLIEHYGTYTNASKLDL